MYDFSPYYHAAGYIYILPVALAFAMLRENRTRAALLILLPMFLVWGVWKVFSVLVGLPDEFMSLISAILVGFSTVWLLGDRIVNRHPFLTILLAAAVMLMCAATIMAEATFSHVLTVATGLAIILCGFVMAGFLCRRRFSTVRFSLWLGLGLLAGATVFIGVYIVIEMFSHFNIYYLAIFLIAVPIYTVVIWGGVLPFLALFFMNEFWRRRFDAVILRKKIPPPQTAEKPQP